MVEIKDIDWSDKPKDVRKTAEKYIKRGKFDTYVDGCIVE